MKRLIIVLLALILVGCSSININETEPLDGKAILVIKNKHDELLDDVELLNIMEKETITIEDEEVTGVVDVDSEQDVTTVHVNSSPVPTEKPEQPKSTPIPSPTPSPTPKPTVAPTVAPTPKPTETPKPSQACPNGKDPNRPCSDILDTNYYYATFSTHEEADNEGYRIGNEVEYVNGYEVTNHSVQPVYKNDHSIAYYGLNLWSNGTLIK